MLKLEDRDQPVACTPRGQVRCVEGDGAEEKTGSWGGEYGAAEARRLRGHVVELRVTTSRENNDAAWVWGWGLDSS